LISIGETRGASISAEDLPLEDLTLLEKAQFVVQDGQVLLVGSQSVSSGSRAFPAREVCLETGARDMEAMTFGPFGRLYSWTTVHVSASKSVPYTVGYVDFENGVRVFAEIRADGNEVPGCDDEVELGADKDSWFVTGRKVK
jgi:uncharacterized OB-fold protein